MPRTAPSPQAAQARLAEQFGQLSAEIAADSGGNCLSALLVSLINLIVQVLRSINWDIAEAAAPSEAEASDTPKQPSETPVRATTTPRAASKASPRPRKSRLQQLRVADTGIAPKADLQASANASSEIRRPGARKGRLQSGAKRRDATVAPRPFSKIRARGQMFPHDHNVTMS